MKKVINISLKTEAFSIFLIVLMFGFAFCFYKLFPTSTPVHWNISGEADSWGTPFQAAFIMPIIGLGLYLLFLIIPFLDPKKERYKQFEKSYHIFKTIIILFLFLVYFSTSLSGLGYNINITRVVTIFVGIMFMVIGNYLSRIKRNWFVGIRTPWTLSSEEVWNKTHRLGSKVFVVSGFLFILTSFIDVKFRLALLFSIIILIILTSFGYSYYLYNKQEKNDNK